MESHFLCPFCGQKLKADDEAAGKPVDCPHCGGEFLVPEPPVDEQMMTPPAAALDPMVGRYTCPTCWMRFDAGSAMHISVHDSLKGDPILGQDAQQRFLAMRFNDRSQALDAMGIACTEMACPHCRRRLPVGFFEEAHHIFSLVGDQSAGKSYYLSVLTQVLPATLFNDFGVTMQDADPTGNAPLNEMRKSLFSAQSPEQIKVEKTKMEGSMYERLPRQGRVVALPRPFIYTLGRNAPGSGRCSIIFYDNAGEHFQPGVSITDRPGAMHVASADAIFFLFDPFNNLGFRRAIGSTKDPQIEQVLVDQQDIIISEMRSRILNVRGLSPGQRITQPLAVMVGKFDAWRHLLPSNTIQNPIANGSVCVPTIRGNSDHIRALLLSLCPTVVANAEALSTDVMYFAVSAFGHPPIKVGARAYAPDPARLKPHQVEVAPLWVLAKLNPELIASRS